MCAHWDRSFWQAATTREGIMQQTPEFVQEVSDGCTLSVHVHPGARRRSINGIHAGAVKISLTTPPVDGRANEALIAFLAELLRLPQARIVIVRGAASRTKFLRITERTRLRFRPRSFRSYRANLQLFHLDCGVRSNCDSLPRCCRHLYVCACHGGIGNGHSFIGLNADIL